MTTVARIEGMEELNKQLKQFLPRVAINIARRTTHRISAAIRDELRKAAPKVTGTLQKAITNKRERGNPNQVESAVYITHGKSARYDAWYWRFVEYGTTKLSAKPFIGPVVERWRPIYRKELEAELRKQIARELGKKKPGAAA